MLEEDESADESTKPTQEDLDAAFTLADDDKSGDVDQQEFVQIMKLISAGKVTGLGRPGWFQKAALEEKYKTDLATEAAAEAQDAAAAAAKEAVELAEKSKAAAAKVEAAKAAAAKGNSSKAKAGAAFSADEATEVSWRELFKSEAGEDKILNMEQFDSVMKKVSSNSKVPNSKDLDAAFVVANEDNSGGVDEDEFIIMMKVIKAGSADGLSDGEIFSASSEKSAMFKAALKEAEDAAAAKKAKDLKAAFEKGAAGDEVAKAEAEALALEISVKDAAKRTKAAEKEAAEAAAKVAILKGETTHVQDAEAAQKADVGKAREVQEEVKDSVNEVVVPAPKSQELPDEKITAQVAPPAASQQPNHDRILMRIYEAEDGFRGSYDEVVAYEERMHLKKGNEHEVGMKDPSHNEQVLLRIYEAPDGFRGSYDEVVAHEEKLNLGKSHEVEADKNDHVVMHLYEVSLVLNPSLLSV